MTVFDATTLQHLVDDDSGSSFVLDLARTYRRMLPTRVSRTVVAVMTFDAEDALDTVLSLKVSSTMTGALELADLAATIEADLRAGDLRRAHARVDLLAPAAERADAAIGAWLATVTPRPTAAV
ncbi:hypothetical protein [Nocardioides marinquilinus]